MDIIRPIYINDMRMYLSLLSQLLKKLAFMKILVFLNYVWRVISLSTVLYNLNYAILVVVSRTLFQFY